MTRVKRRSNLRRKSNSKHKRKNNIRRKNQKNRRKSKKIRKKRMSFNFSVGPDDKKEVKDTTINVIKKVKPTRPPPKPPLAPKSSKGSTITDIKIGDRVEVHSLVQSIRLNGLKGFIISINKELIEVILDDKEIVTLVAKNIRVIPESEEINQTKELPISKQSDDEILLLYQTEVIKKGYNSPEAKIILKDIALRHLVKNKKSPDSVDKLIDCTSGLSGLTMMSLAKDWLKDNDKIRRLSNELENPKLNKEKTPLHRRRSSIGFQQSLVVGNTNLENKQSEPKKRTSMIRRLSGVGSSTGKWGEKEQLSEFNIYHEKLMNVISLYLTTSALLKKAFGENKSRHKLSVNIRDYQRLLSNLNNELTPIILSITMDRKEIKLGQEIKGYENLYDTLKINGKLAPDVPNNIIDNFFETFDVIGSRMDDIKEYTKGAKPYTEWKKEDQMGEIIKYINVLVGAWNDSADIVDKGEVIRDNIKDKTIMVRLQTAELLKSKWVNSKRILQDAINTVLMHIEYEKNTKGQIILKTLTIDGLLSPDISEDKIKNFFRLLDKCKNRIKTYLNPRILESNSQIERIGKRNELLGIAKKVGKAGIKLAVL